MISQGSRRLLPAARTRQSIRHPHLVAARVVQDEQGRVRLLLQRFEVPTLGEVLLKGPVPIPNCLRLLYGIASAVEALTAEGLVARDLDPDRILVCPRRGALLADPGIPLEVLPRGTEPDRASAFTSPEERAGLPIDARSNVYSLGAVFLAAITAPDGERLHIPDSARDVIARAMATEPEKRDSSPSEFIVALAISLGFQRKGEAAPAPDPPKQTETAPPAPTEAEPVATEPSREEAPRGPAAKPKSRASRVSSARGAKPEPNGAKASKPDARAKPKSRASRVSPAGRAKPQPNGAKESKPEAAAKPKAPPPRVSPAGRGKTQPNGAKESKPKAAAKPKARPPRVSSAGRAKTQPNGAKESKPDATAKPRSRPRRVPPPPRPTQPPDGRKESQPELTTPPRGVPTPRRPRPRLPGASLRVPRRISPVAAGLALALLAALVGGVMLGSNVGSDPKPTRVESGAFALDLPEEWGETGVVRTTWVKLIDPVAAAPFAERGVGLVVGEVSDLTAIDRRFRAEGERTAVRLGPLQAWRYAGLRPAKGLAATAYLAPTTGAPLLVVCHARVRAAGPRLRQCEEIASTVALKDVEPASLVRVDRYEQQVASVIGGLRRERVEARRRLADAKLASGQARAARSLEREYRVAVRRLRSMDAPPGTRIADDLLSSLRAAAAAYGQLAAAAAHTNAAQYRAAREAIVHREQAVQREAAI